MGKVIGIKMVDYKKANGTPVQGVEIVYTFERKHFEGVDADRQFIYKSTIDENMGGLIPSIGDEIEFTYGKSREGKAYVNGYRLK